MAVKLSVIISLLCIGVTMLGACRLNTEPASTNDVVKPAAAAENSTLPKPINRPEDPAADTQTTAIKPDRQEKIVFWSKISETSKHDIFIMDPNGNNPVNLTNNSASDIQPSLSPDGKSILFISDRPWEPDNKYADVNNYNVYVMDIDGNNLRNITGNRVAQDMMPSWSPDGTMIAFCSTKDGWWDIFITDKDGHNFLNLSPERNSHDFNFPTWPIWSPDGTKIYYGSGQSGSYEIYSMDIDYTMIRQIVLTPTPDNYAGQEWTTTGNRQVVRSPLSVHVKEPWIKGVRQLTRGSSGWNGKTAMSADGKKILYVGGHPRPSTQSYDIFVMDSDGSNQTNLTNDCGTFDDWPAWSPNGKKIAYVSGPNPDYEYSWQIFEMNADGSYDHQITYEGYSNGSPNWGSIPNDLAEKLKVP